MDEATRTQRRPASGGLELPQTLRPSSGQNCSHQNHCSRLQEFPCPLRPRLHLTRPTQLLLQAVGSVPIKRWLFNRLPRSKANTTKQPTTQTHLLGRWRLAILGRTRRQSGVWSPERGHQFPRGLGPSSLLPRWLLFLCCLLRSVIIRSTLFPVLPGVWAW